MGIALQRGHTSYQSILLNPMRLTVCALCIITTLSAQSGSDLRSHILYAPAFPEIVDTLRVRQVPITISQFQDIIMNAGMAESSGGLPSQMFGDDSVSVGWWQNKITVYLPRHHPDGWTEIDSIAAVMRLVTDHYLNQEEYLQTFLEMLRVMSQWGYSGEALLENAIRATNRGRRRAARLDAAGTVYYNKLMNGIR